jgi:hypothetical protein
MPPGNERTPIHHIVNHGRIPSRDIAAGLEFVYVNRYDEVFARAIRG